VNSPVLFARKCNLCRQPSVLPTIRRRFRAQILPFPTFLRYRASPWVARCGLWAFLLVEALMQHQRRSCIRRRLRLVKQRAVGRLNALKHFSYVRALHSHSQSWPGSIVALWSWLPLRGVPAPSPSCQTHLLRRSPHYPFWCTPLNVSLLPLGTVERALGSQHSACSGCACASCWHAPLADVGLSIDAALPSVHLSRSVACDWPRCLVVCSIERPRHRQLSRRVAVVRRTGAMGISSPSARGLQRILPLSVLRHCAGWHPWPAPTRGGLPSGNASCPSLVP